MKQALIVFVLLVCTLVGQSVWADSLDVHLVGEWPFCSPYAVAGDAARNLVFCGAGGGVYVLDVSDPSAPRKLSERIHAADWVCALSYDPATRRLVAGTEGGMIEIWDVNDPQSPVRLGECPVSRYVGRITAQNGIAYVCCGDSALCLVDISIPQNPHEVGRYIAPDYTYDAAIAGGYAFVACGVAGLRVVDVSIPGAPHEVGFYDTPDIVISVAIQGRKAYITDSEWDLYILDVTIPARPQLLGHSVVDGHCADIKVEGSHAYIYSCGGLWVFDVSDSSNPQPMGVCDLIASHEGEIAAFAGHVFGTDQEARFYVIDVADPSNPTGVGSFLCPDFAHDLALLDHSR